MFFFWKILPTSEFLFKKFLYSDLFAASFSCLPPRKLYIRETSFCELILVLSLRPQKLLRSFLRTLVLEPLDGSRQTQSRLRTAKMLVMILNVDQRQQVV